MRYQKIRLGTSKISMEVKVFLALGIIALTAIGIALGVLQYQREHFRQNTFIEKVDCSQLTVEQALAKLQEELNRREITLAFVDNVQYKVKGEQFHLSMEPQKQELTEELQRLLEGQHTNQPKERYNYFLETSIYVNEEELRAYLDTLPELEKSNMVKPQNAYISKTQEGTLTIVPEVYGTEINYEVAVDFCMKELSLRKDKVDFATIMTDRNPKVLSNDAALQQEVDSVNTILNTTIRFELYDGSFFTLDKERMKNWVEKDEAGHYFVNLEENLRVFLEELDAAASRANSTIVFQPTDSEPLTLSVPEQFRAKVDIEKELEIIKEELMSSSTLEREPVYTRIFDTRNLLNYIEIDLIRQRVLMYIDGVCVVDTPCVTGNVKRHNATPPGIFYLTYKTRNAILMGNSFVKYWMPFNRGIGLHDASWRDEFGGDIYKENGSHGCVNLPEWAAKTIYEYINETIPIIVYEGTLQVSEQI